MTEQEWRDNLKIGDPVLLATVYRHINGSVMRTTPTQIIIVIGGVERRYLKRNGHRIGEIHGWISRPEVPK